MTTASTDPFAAVLQRLKAKPSGSGFVAKCPAHDDRNPSLSISEGRDGRVLLRCHAGCRTKEILAALGLKMRDLFRTDTSRALPFTESSNPRPPQKQAEKPATPGSIYIPTDEERERWTKACDTLASDPQRCGRLAKARGWKPETIHGLAVEGSLGYEDGKLCFLYDTGAKVRFRQRGERVIYWLFGKPCIWRGAYLSIPSRTKVLLCEGETDAIALLDAGIENDPAQVVVAIPSASTFNENWAALFQHKNIVLCFDDDDAGNAAVDRVAKILRPYARTVKALDWEAIRHAY